MSNGESARSARYASLKAAGLHPVTSLVGGALLGTAIGFDAADWLGGIAAGVLGSLAILYLQELLKVKDSFRRTRDDSSTILAEMKLSVGLKELREQALMLPNDHRGIYSDIANQVSSRGGAIVIGAQEEKYLEYLDALLGASKSSILATLRGGEHPQFPLEWFFQDTPMLSSAKRINWLTAVRDAPLERKVRLLIFAEEDISSFFMNRAKRAELLDAMLGDSSTEPGKVYQVDPGDLLPILGSSAGDEENRIVYDDFAIFDDEVVLKHNGAASLSVSIRDQVSAYMRPFEAMVKRPKIFKQVTLKHYGGTTWDEWETTQAAPSAESADPATA